MHWWAKRRLLQGMATGRYPKTLCLSELQKKDTSYHDGKTYLHKIALHGKYPEETTPKDLAETKDKHGSSALHSAATNGNYPQNTTCKDLATAKNNYGNSALEIAAISGKYPPNTSVEDLIVGHALQNAAEWNNLPPDTHLEHLLNYLTQNQTALDIWISKKKKPEELKPLLDRTKTTNITAAKQIALRVNTIDASATALWLAQQLNRKNTL